MDSDARRDKTAKGRQWLESIHKYNRDLDRARLEGRDVTEVLIPLGLDSWDVQMARERRHSWLRDEFESQVTPRWPDDTDEVCELATNMREFVGEISDLLATALLDIEWLTRKLNQLLPKGPISPVHVNVDTLTIQFGDEVFEVPSETAARWVKVLADHPGEWIATKNLKRYDPLLEPVLRTKPLKRKLPAAIKALIESERGKGSRLVAEFAQE